jgi:hypothetical protein
VLADFFSHPLPQGLVLARGPVAAQMYEFSYTENPPNCVGGIRELFYCLVIASLLLALLLNTSRSLLLLRINCLVSTVFYLFILFCIYYCVQYLNIPHIMNKTGGKT